MRLNAFFPSIDIGTDPIKIRDWAQAAEDLGYAYIEVPDHVFRPYRKNPKAHSGREIEVASEKPINGNVLLR